MTPATAQPKKARRSSRPWWLVRFACLCSLLKKKKKSFDCFIILWWWWRGYEFHWLILNNT